MLTVVSVGVLSLIPLIAEVVHLKYHTVPSDGTVSTVQTDVPPKLLMGKLSDHASVDLENRN